MTIALEIGKLSRGTFQLLETTSTSLPDVPRRGDVVRRDDGEYIVHRVTWCNAYPPRLRLVPAPQPGDEREVGELVSWRD